MRGIGGKPGWFWLFLLEGFLTVIIALIVSWLLAHRAMAYNPAELPLSSIISCFYKELPLPSHMV
jgi:ABC-type multidrug transport system permease subunit